MFDRCVYFGFLFTSDDNLGRTFILPYGTFSSTDASKLLIPVNRLLHVGLNQAFTAVQPRRTPINGVYTVGRLSFHSPFSQMYVRADVERSLLGTPMYLLLVDAPNRHTVQFL